MKYPVLLPNIFDHPFTYESDLKISLKPGDYVEVPFGKSKIIGVVWNYEEAIGKKILLKKIIKRVNIPKMKISMIKFINWFAKYNCIKRPK